MFYSSPAFLWANIHLLLIMQENNVQPFCLLLTENSVSWEEKEQTQFKNWVTLISFISMSIPTEIWKDVKYLHVFMLLNVPIKKKNILWPFQKDL